MGYGYRMFLLARDKSYINDIVDDKGYVHKKGELLNVIEREKHSSLVVQEYQKEQDAEKAVHVLVHHISKTGERIGMPRWEYIQPKGLLSALKYAILDKIEKDELEFEGKIYQMNPMKVRLLAYTKEWTRAEELPQPSEYSNGQSEKDETIQSRFGQAVRYMRVGVVHSSISKMIKALKLQVE